MPWPEVAIGPLKASVGLGGGRSKIVPLVVPLIIGLVVVNAAVILLVVMLFGVPQLLPFYEFGGI